MHTFIYATLPFPISSFPIFNNLAMAPPLNAEWRVNIESIHPVIAMAAKTEPPISPSQPALFTCPPPTLNIVDQFRAGSGCLALKAFFLAVFLVMAVLGTLAGSRVWWENSRAVVPEKVQQAPKQRVEVGKLSAIKPRTEQRDKQFLEAPKVTKIEIEARTFSHIDLDDYTLPEYVWVPQKLDCDAHGIICCKKCRGIPRKQHGWKQVILETMRADYVSRNKARPSRSGTL